ncbi:hypothetical protein D3C81_1399470 [compost metagenome]
MVTIEGRVEFAHYFFGFLVAGADNDAVGTHAVCYCRAFLKEFGVGYHVEGQFGSTTLCQDFGDPGADLVGGSDRHGGLVDHDSMVFHMPGNIFRYCQHVLQIR